MSSLVDSRWVGSSRNGSSSYNHHRRRRWPIVHHVPGYDGLNLDVYDDDDDDETGLVRNIIILYFTYTCTGCIRRICTELICTRKAYKRSRLGGVDLKKKTTQKLYAIVAGKELIGVRSKIKIRFHRKYTEQYRGTRLHPSV